MEAGWLAARDAGRGEGGCGGWRGGRSGSSDSFIHPALKQPPRREAEKCQRGGGMITSLIDPLFLPSPEDGQSTRG